MRNILVIAHSAHRSGGAEKALFDLVAQMTSNGDCCTVLLPGAGDETTRYSDAGVRVVVLPSFLWAIPHFARAMLDQSLNVDWAGIADQLRPNGFTHVLSNTIVQLTGAILADHLGVPHILYAHEYVCRGLGFDLTPSAIGGEQYCRLLGDWSDQVWTCSNYVGSQFEKHHTVYPHFQADEGVATPEPRSFDPAKPLMVACIGTRSVRKNVAFLMILAKAVKLLGMSVNFAWIGGPGDGDEIVELHMQRRAIQNMTFLPHIENPMEKLASMENVVIAIVSHNEPFGLTMIEAAARRIPVISSRCGGPEEFIQSEQLFDVDNIHEAVRCLRHVVANYTALSHACSPLSPSRVGELLDTCTYTSKPQIRATLERFRAIRLHDRTPERVVELIAEVFPDVEPEALVAEHANPGVSVLCDVRRFGATPFSYSDQMDTMYRDGVGMAIELADTMHSSGKEYMVSFVLSHLLRHPDAQVLSVGDGIATDSIRLARAGVHVSYLDFDGGKMTEVARRNVQDSLGSEFAGSVRFVTDDEANKSPFQFVMCFEVIEHVQDPWVIVQSLARKTAQGGIAWVSECFVGVEDQWCSHLYSNEKYTAMLPAMMDPWFELLDVHKGLPGKPYMFRRTSLSADADVMHPSKRWFMKTSTHASVTSAIRMKTNSSVS